MEEYIINKPMITFAKNVYRHFVDHKTYKKIYNVESKIFTFDFSNHDNIEIIRNVWFDNYESVNKISVIYVPKYNLPQNNLSDKILRELWIKDETKLVTLNENMTLDEILSIPNTILINSISVDMLKYINSYKKNKNDYLNLELSSSAYISSLIDKSNYNLVLYFEKKNDLIKPINLVVQFYVVKNDDEQRRFKNGSHICFNYGSHMCLIKRQIEIEYTVKSDEKIIPQYINTSLVTIVIKSEKELKKIQIAENIFYDTRYDPDNIYKSDDHFFYVLDQIDEKSGFTKDAQPQSNYVFSNTDTIDITHDYDYEIPITITYFLYDIHDYGNNIPLQLLSYSLMLNKQTNDYLISEINENLKTDNKLSEEEFEQLYKNVKLTNNHFNMDLSPVKLITYTDYETMYENEHPIEDQINEDELVINEEEQVLNERFVGERLINEEEQVNEEEPVLNRRFVGERVINEEAPLHVRNENPWAVDYNYENNNDRFLNLYCKYIKIFINDVEKVHSKNQLLPNDTLCEVTLEPIKINQYYYSCPRCNGKFEATTYKTWIEDSTKSKKCPKCQLSINQIPQLYKNNTFPNSNTFIFYGSIIITIIGIIGMITNLTKKII